jgi:hypothetical protein
MTIEFKGVDAIETENRLKILMASNKDWVVPSSKDERRFFCLDVDEKFTNKDERVNYFDALYKTIEDNTTVSMFMDYLQTIDLINFNIREYPETEANKNQRMQSLGVIPRFLLDACNRGYLLEELTDTPAWHERVQTELIIEGLNQWGKNNFKNGYERPTSNDVRKYLNETLKLTSKANRQTAYFSKGSAIISYDSKQGYELRSSDYLKGIITESEGLPIL